MFARARIAEGKNMAEPLMQTNVFPLLVVQMVGVGEQTGALDTMLNKIARFLRRGGRRRRLGDDGAHRAGDDGRRSAAR